jgi:hypothetical protein
MKHALAYLITARAVAAASLVVTVIYGLRAGRESRPAVISESRRPDAKLAIGSIVPATGYAIRASAHAVGCVPERQPRHVILDAFIGQRGVKLSGAYGRHKGWATDLCRFNRDCAGLCKSRSGTLRMGQRLAASGRT